MEENKLNGIGAENEALEPIELQYSEPMPQKRFEITKRDTVFALLLTIASVIMSAFGLWGGLRAGFTFSAILMAVISTVYMFSKNVKLKAFPLICAITAVATAFSFTVTSNGSVRFFGFIVLNLLTLVWFASLISDRPEKGDLGLLVTIFQPVFRLVIPHIPTTVVSLLAGGGERRKTLWKALLGVVLAMPVLFVVVPLLMSSDAAFSGLAERLVSDLALTVFKVAVGLVLAMFVIAYCFTLKKRELPEIRESRFAGFDNAVIISFLSVLSVCYLTYLFSQLAYFFSAFSGFLPEDYSFTPAEYARRGFFEMSIIAAINLIIIFTSLLVSRKKDGKICIASRVLCTFISVFTLIIIATAISKMVLYIDRFGMTVLRITTSFFMVFLAVVFISLMLRVFLPRVRVLRTALVSAGLVLAVLGIVNVNSVVADYNYNAYTNGSLEDIDIYTIYELGEEGVPYLVKLTEDSSPEVRSESKQKLLRAITSGKYYEYEVELQDGITVYKITDKKYDGIGQYSFSRAKAYKALDGFLADNPDFLKVSREEYNSLY